MPNLCDAPLQSHLHAVPSSPVIHNELTPVIPALPRSSRLPYQRHDKKGAGHSLELGDFSQANAVVGLMLKTASASLCLARMPSWLHGPAGLAWTDVLRFR